MSATHPIPSLQKQESAGQHGDDAQYEMVVELFERRSRQRLMTRGPETNGGGGRQLEREMLPSTDGCCGE